MINLLVEIETLTPSGQVVTLNLSSAGNYDASGTQLDGKEWIPIITRQPTCSVTWTDEGIASAATVEYTSIGLTIPDDFFFDWSVFNRYGGLARIWRGNAGDAFADYRQIYVGRIGAIAREGRDAELPLLSNLSDIINPLLTATYAGTDQTGGPEGQAELRGKPKPICFGDCRNIEPVLVDPVNLIFQYHAYGPTGGIDAIYEGALALGAPVTTVGTWAELAALDLKGGQWAAAPAIGGFRMGSQAGLVVTADVKGGLFNDAYSNQLGSILRLILRQAGVADAMVHSSITSRGEEWQLYASDQINVLDVITDALLQVGCALIPSSTGQYSCVDAYAQRQPLVIDAENREGPNVLSVRQLTVEPPVYRVIVNGERAWRVHTASEILPALTVLSDELEAKEAAIEEAKRAADAAQALAEEQERRIDQYDDDGVLSRGEKSDQLRAYQNELSAHALNMSKSAEFDVAVFRKAYDDRWKELVAYLNTLTPSFFDPLGVTNIDGTYATTWKAYYDAKITLLNAMTGDAKRRAEWTMVDGAPGDLHGLDPNAGTKLDGIEPNATVGGTVGAGGNIKNPDGTPFTGTDPAQVNQLIDDATAGLASDVAKARADLLTARSDIDRAVSDGKLGDDQLRTSVSQLRLDTDAAITETKRVLRLEDKAISDRVVTVESQMSDTAPSGLKSYIATVSGIATTAAGKADAVAGRTDTVEAQLRGDAASGLKSSIASVNDTATTAASTANSVASRTNTVEAQLRGETSSGLSNTLATVSQTASGAASTAGSAAQIANEAKAQAGPAAAWVTTNGAATVDALTGIAAAKWTAGAVTPAGAASITLTSSTNNGGAVEIVGNVTFRGKLAIGQYVTGPRTEITDRYIVFVDQQVMTAQGLAFGSNNQFIQWVGPVRSSLAQCNEADAISYIKTDGSAYYGGSLSSGILTNSGGTTLASADSYQLGPFTSAGKPVLATFNIGFTARLGTSGVYVGDGYAGNPAIPDPFAGSRQTWRQTMSGSYIGGSGVVTAFSNQAQDFTSTSTWTRIGNSGGTEPQGRYQWVHAIGGTQTFTTTITGMGSGDGRSITGTRNSLINVADGSNVRGGITGSTISLRTAES